MSRISPAFTASVSTANDARTRASLLAPPSLVAILSTRAMNSSSVKLRGCGGICTPACSAFGSCASRSRIRRRSLSGRARSTSRRSILLQLLASDRSLRRRTRPFPRASQDHLGFRGWTHGSTQRRQPHAAPDASMDYGCPPDHCANSSAVTVRQAQKPTPTWQCSPYRCPGAFANHKRPLTRTALRETAGEQMYVMNLFSQRRSRRFESAHLHFADTLGVVTRTPRLLCRVSLGPRR